MDQGKNDQSNKLPKEKKPGFFGGKSMLIAAIICFVVSLIGGIIGDIIRLGGLMFLVFAIFSFISKRKK